MYMCRCAYICLLYGQTKQKDPLPCLLIHTKKKKDVEKLFLRHQVYVHQQKRQKVVSFPYSKLKLVHPEYWLNFIRAHAWRKNLRAELCKLQLSLTQWWIKVPAWVLSRFSHIWLFVTLGCSPPSSSVHGIFQARMLEWVAISSFKGSSQLRDPTASFMSLELAGTFFITSAPGTPSIKVN